MDMSRTLGPFGIWDIVLVMGNTEEYNSKWR